GNRVGVIQFNRCCTRSTSVPVVSRQRFPILTTACVNAQRSPESFFALSRMLPAPLPVTKNSKMPLPADRFPSGCPGVQTTAMLLSSDDTYKEGPPIFHKAALTVPHVCKTKKSVFACVLGSKKCAISDVSL